MSPSFPRTKEIQKDWSKLNPVLWPGAGNGHPLQLEAALTIDAVTAIVNGLTSLLKADYDLLRESFKRGKLDGVQCRHNPAVWKLGPNIMRHLKQVSNISDDNIFCDSE